MLVGISLRPWRRTTRGTSSLPTPCPSKSSSIVTRDALTAVERVDGYVDACADRSF